MIPVKRAINASPTKLHTRLSVVPLIALLINAIRRALQPPLIKPVKIAIATFNQEARTNSQIKFMLGQFQLGYS